MGRWKEVGSQRYMVKGMRSVPGRLYEKDPKHFKLESFPVLFGISSCYDAKERVGIGACYSSVHSACGSEGGCADRLGGSWCFPCKQDEESANDILIHCGSGNLWEGQEEVLEDYPSVCFESYGEIMIQAALLFLESLKLKVRLKILLVPLVIAYFPST
ncbi:hypothetical protein CK203_006282 [Vitis vinifera]|uniref:Uncharacterized protein n=1 Tax=Vitis vinifera TaxID=29760 RepID=A0A438K629_VITVI|nr:hypothetical protein CK203_006282 [Vitis vinifera]